jgi:UDPglucose 6-dehydrogenase
MLSGTVIIQKERRMRISVIGAGYVGLITGVCLAKLGNEVTLIEIDAQKVKALNDRVPPIHEEGLAELMGQVDMDVSSDHQKSRHSEVIFICAGTPSNEDGTVFLGHITAISDQISKVLRSRGDYCVVVVKSTVPPDTTEGIVVPILEKSGKKCGKDFGVCMSPEFLREGKAIYDFMNPARLIVGECDKRSGDTFLRLYESFDAPILRTTLRTAEMIKLASNAFLATKISFVNEIGNICKRLHMDVYDVAEGMGLDDRIGKKFLNAGIGFGGSCIPKDIRMLKTTAREVGYQPRFLDEVTNLNDQQAIRLVRLAKKHVNLEGATIGLLGLAFKPGTDDVRDSRAIAVVKALLGEQALVKAYDPLAVENFRKMFPNLDYVSKEEVLNCEAILILTEWEEFNELDYRGKIVIDGRRVARARDARIYEGICW